jgi:hypothetical protein
MPVVAEEGKQLLPGGDKCYTCSYLKVEDCWQQW